jgi:hypothetical protein
MEMITGDFMEELRDIASDNEAALIVMGAGGAYNDLLSWDANIIDAFVDLRTPVLVIPSKIEYHPIKKVAFCMQLLPPGFADAGIIYKAAYTFYKCKALRCACYESCRNSK